MTLQIEKYNPSQEICDMFLEVMNKISNDIRTQTGAPEGACATAAIMVVKTLTEAMEGELKVIALPDEDSEVRH